MGAEEVKRRRRGVEASTLLSATPPAGVDNRMTAHVVVSRAAGREAMPFCAWALSCFTCTSRQARYKPRYRRARKLKKVRKRKAFLRAFSFPPQKADALPSLFPFIIYKLYICNNII